MSDATVGAAPAAVLRRLRRTRQLHRLGSLDWFDVAYRVYLFALIGGGVLLMVSDQVKDSPIADTDLAEVVTKGPRLLGLIVALAVLAGLRGGANGGPLALEGADVVHVMLAPIDRRVALARPAVQRLRAAVFAGAGLGAVAGQLAGRRLPGTILAWFAGGALFGATLALLWFGAALLAHTLRLPRWLATLTGMAVCMWQGAAVAWAVPGPATTTGRLGMWGWSQQPIDLVGLGVGVAATAAGLRLLRRISLDALARRSTLVAQLRFAVTMQDLRTVILLRRQLNQEHARSRPWFRPRPSTRTAGFNRKVWRRGWHGLLRFPAGRLVRMAGLAVAIGLLHAAALRGTSPAFIGAALASFVLGLELLEPLSQEVDQPDRTDALPVDRGELMMRHLYAPLAASVPFAVLTAAAAVASLGTQALAPAAVLALPLLAAGTMGSVVSVVRDAPDPAASSAETFVPPEVAGLTTTLRLAWPLVVSAVGAAMVFFPRAAWQAGDSTVAGAVRGALGAVLLVVLVGYWVKVRDHVHRRMRSFMSEGRDYTSAQRAGRRETL